MFNRSLQHRSQSIGRSFKPQGLPRALVETQGDFVQVGFKNERVVGIVSRANLVQALATLLPGTTGIHPKDDEIRRQILDEIAKRSWAPQSLVNVVVRGGVAELWGTIFDERERQALKVAAENIDGVKSVKDHLVFVEPISGFILEGEDDKAPG